MKKIEKSVVKMPQKCQQIYVKVIPSKKHVHEYSYINRITDFWCHKNATNLS